MMDREIKRLLKLKRIPNFKLSDKEEFMLEEWMESQKPVEAPKKRKYTRKKKKTDELTTETSDNSQSEAPERELEQKTTNEPSKVQNVVRTADMTLNEVES